MSVHSFTPSPEQQHLLELLFVNHPQHVALALTLLEKRTDQSFFLRPLAFLVRCSDDYQACMQVEKFLKHHMAQAWEEVQPELDILEDALDMDGNMLTKAQIVERVERYRPWAAAYEYCMGLNRDFTRLYEHFIDDLREFGLVEEAQHCLLVLQRLFPEEPEYFSEYAILLGNHTDTQAEQLAHLKRAATSPKTTPEYINRLAQYYDEILDDSEQSLHWLQQSLQLSATEPFTHFMLADHYRRKAEQLQQADHHYHQAAMISDEDGFYCAHYAWFLLQTERPDEALEWATQAIALQANTYRFGQPLAFHSCLAAVYWYGFQDRAQAEALLAEMAEANASDAMGEQISADMAAGNTQLPHW